MPRLLPVIGSLAAVAYCQTASPRPLTIEEIVRQTRSGISEEIIVTSIKKSGKAFNLSTDEILELQRHGVTEAVITILLDPAKPYTPPAPPPPVAVSEPPVTPAAPKKPVNPLSEKVPPEPGMYLAAGPDENEFVRLEFKTLTAAKAGKMPGILTAGLKKSPVVGYLVGPHAKTRISGRSPVFYLRLPEKVAIEEVLLVALTAKRDRREIELGPDSGKPVFPVGSIRQYESKEIVPGLFRISLVTLDAGEHMFYLLGSADEKKGIVGKGFDFGLP